tara:strand:+ start:695 stop:1165 length:471 start_codon:yes stop_codon:yes gene_type:complete
MARKKVPSIYKYGIEITKPFSKEMYDHNDKVSVIMKANILSAWIKLLDEYGDFDMDTEWCVISDDSDIAKLQKEICYSGYGGGYTISNVDKEVRDELENLANYQLAEIYPSLVEDGFVKDFGVGMIGYEDKKEILELRKNSANINTMTVSFDNENK